MLVHTPSLVHNERRPIDCRFCRRFVFADEHLDTDCRSSIKRHIQKARRELDGWKDNMRKLDIHLEAKAEAQ